MIVNKLTEKIQKSLEWGSSRYQIDELLLKDGYNPVDIEAAWQRVGVTSANYRFVRSKKLRGWLIILCLIGIAGLISLVIVKKQISTNNLITASKTSYTVTIKPTANAQQAWQTRWLQGIPCKAPCWEGITLGVTTIEDAMQILNKNNLVKSASLDLVDWVWQDGSSGGYFQYPSYVRHLVHHEPLDIKEKITVVIPYYSTSVRLGDVINSYGQPSHIDVGKAAKNVYFVFLAYVPQGFMFFTYYPEKPTIDANLLLSNPKFYVPNMDGLKSVFASEIWVQEWQGFQTFKFYCGNYSFCD